MIHRLRTWLDELGAIEWEVGIVEGGIAEVMDGQMNVKWLQYPVKDRWFADPFVLEVDNDSIVLLVEVYSKKNI